MGGNFDGFGLENGREIHIVREGLKKWGERGVENEVGAGTVVEGSLHIHVCETKSDRVALVEHD